MVGSSHFYYWYISRSHWVSPIIFVGNTTTSITLPDKPYQGYTITIRKTGTSTSTITISPSNGTILNTTSSASSYSMGTTIYSVTFGIRSANDGYQSWMVISTY